MNTRRTFFNISLLAALSLCTQSFGQTANSVKLNNNNIKLSLKMGMVGFGKTPDEKFKGIQELGYDGMELNSPGGLDKTASLAASKKYNFPIHDRVGTAHCIAPPLPPNRTCGFPAYGSPVSISSSGLKVFPSCLLHTKQA
jgi:hexulose-6-phosphate isomerase